MGLGVRFEAVRKKKEYWRLLSVGVAGYKVKIRISWKS